MSFEGVPAQVSSTHELQRPITMNSLNESLPGEFRIGERNAEHASYSSVQKPCPALCLSTISELLYLLDVGHECHHCGISRCHTLAPTMFDAITRFFT
ncbi:hypothetical protein QCA50_019693 [Cerrena zonata]|uniref:Uncharacterized protein n=1 Tax=Cerrena zonata TaxID=2478898 RepID=A0AAW0F937_9APHY